VIARPEFDRYVNDRRRARFRRILLQKAKISQITVRLPQVTDDPDDNMVIEAAHSARTRYIVTGDNGLLRLKRFMGIKIVTVDEALRNLTK
jgi:predicted nucleic acid-binding protein